MDSAKVCCGDKSAVIRLNDLLQEKQLLEALKGEKNIIIQAAINNSNFPIYEQTCIQ